MTELGKKIRGAAIGLLTALVVVAGGAGLASCAGVPDAALAGDAATAGPVGSGGQTAQEGISPAGPVPREYPVNEAWTVGPDRVVQGDKEAVAVSGREIRSTYYDAPRVWQQTDPLDGLPVLEAPQMPLLEALYRLSLQQAREDITDNGRPGAPFMAGALWPGVWTRDVSYSIHLALALAFPENAKSSLRAKVDARLQVIQDTGTGGSWPVSTDRVVWAIAAWEIWLVTGDREWLQWSWQVLKNTADKDRLVVWDPRTGLYHGETSFMDWREQTYPIWMQPADIYDSYALGTNLLHWRLNQIIAAMGAELGRPAAETDLYRGRAAELGASIATGFRLADRDWLSAYRYPLLAGGQATDKADTLASSLAALWELPLPAAEASSVSTDGSAPGTPGSAAALMAKLPVVPFGPPIIYPQMAHAGPYHNKAIWPFVTSYYAWAAARSGNAVAADFGLRANLRAAALFLDNKENYVFDTGHFAGTAVNSGRQLWSVAGQMAGVYRVIFGLDFRPEGLAISPCVPAWSKGVLRLSGLHWREAVLDICLEGTGTRISSFRVDGQERAAGTILPNGLKGAVKVEIRLAGDGPLGGVNIADTAAKGPWDASAIAASASPDGTGRMLGWKTRAATGATRLWKNGRLFAETKETSFNLPASDGHFAVWTLQTVGDKGVTANQSEYLIDAARSLSVAAANGRYPAGSLDDGIKGRDGAGVIDLGSGAGTTLELDLDLPAAGNWAFRWRYANANGPVSTDNRCAVRSLAVDGIPVGAVVMPQRGNSWNNWGWSNMLSARLGEGRHVLKLEYRPEDENMNRANNRAMVDYVEAILLD